MSDEIWMPVAKEAYDAYCARMQDIHGMKHNLQPWERLSDTEKKCWCSAATKAAFAAVDRGIARAKDGAVPARPPELDMDGSRTAWWDALAAKNPGAPPAPMVRNIAYAGFKAGWEAKSDAVPPSVVNVCVAYGGGGGSGSTGTATGGNGAGTYAHYPSTVTTCLAGVSGGSGGGGVAVLSAAQAVRDAWEPGDEEVMDAAMRYRGTRDGASDTEPAPLEVPGVPAKLYLEHWPEEAGRDDAIHYERVGYGDDMAGHTSTIYVYVRADTKKGG